MTEAGVYGTRALLVCGYASALYLSLRLANEPDDLRARVKSLLKREVRYARAVGEAGAPLWFNVAAALEALGEISRSETCIYSFARELAMRNRAESRTLTARLPGGVDEDFDGYAYTLHIAIDWLARRWLRQHLAMLWYDATYVQHCDFLPTDFTNYLRWDDEESKRSENVAIS
jgi:hypothetical protein